MRNVMRNIDTRPERDKATGTFVVWLVVYAAIMAAFMALESAPSLMELR